MNAPESVMGQAESLAASVVICTYNRPDLFAATLRSCLRDATRTALSFEIIVADNGPARHARAIIDALATAIPIRCLPCSPPNISVARNAGLAAAAAPLVAFLDDDLEIVPGWLDALVGVMQDPAIDGALGPVHPVFEGGAAPAWDPGGSHFTRDPRLPTGTEIAASGPRRPAGFVVSTASSIWRASTCFTDAEPFDRGFGGCGGEDLDLFLRLQRRGRRFAWCAEAGVRETIPRHRLQWRFQRQRAFTFAQAYAAATLRNSVAPRRDAWRLRATGLAQAAFYATATPLLKLLPDRNAQAQRWTLRLASALGKIRWTDRAGLYQAEQPGSVGGSGTDPT